MLNQKEKITKRYNELAEEFSDQVAQSGYFIDKKPIDEAIFDQWFEKIQEKFSVSSSDFLIDVGCGSGIFLKRFLKYTSHLYGIDPAEKLLVKAKNNCPIAKLKVGTADNIEFDSVKFSRVFCNSVFLYLNSLEHAKKVIAHFIYISTNDAKIWLGDLAYPNPEVNDENFRRKEKSTGWELQHYPPEYLHEVCNEFKVKGTFIRQEIKEKVTGKFRYDFLIEKKR